MEPAWVLLCPSLPPLGVPASRTPTPKTEAIGTCTGTLLLFLGARDSNSGSQAWQEALLSSEPWPLPWKQDLSPHCLHLEFTPTWPCMTSTFSKEGGQRVVRSTGAEQPGLWMLTEFPLLVTPPHLSTQVLKLSFTSPFQVT